MFPNHFTVLPTINIHALVNLPPTLASVEDNVTESLMAKMNRWQDSSCLSTFSSAPIAPCSPLTTGCCIVQFSLWLQKLGIFSFWEEICENCLGQVAGVIISWCRNDESNSFSPLSLSLNLAIKSGMISCWVKQFEQTVNPGGATEEVRLQLCLAVWRIFHL